MATPESDRQAVSEILGRSGTSETSFGADPGARTVPPGSHRAQKKHGPFSGPVVNTVHAQTLWPFATLVVRGAGEVEPLLETVRRKVKALDRGVAVFDVQPLERTVEGSIECERTVAALLGVFAVLAFAIACAGVYVVFALAVANRRRELGIRLSLGARPAEILWEVVREGLRNSLLGTLVGACGSARRLAA